MGDDPKDYIVRCIVAHYDRDILGLPGWVRDDGVVELYVMDGGKVRMPAPAADIIRDIRAREAARWAQQKK